MPKIRKPKRKIAKSRRPQAERAAEHWLHEIMECVKTRRAVRTQWQSVDFFAADVVGKTQSGVHVYAQATAGSHSAVTARRRKLEAIPWHPSDLVYVLQLVEQQDPANARRKAWWFRVHEYEQDLTSEHDAVYDTGIPRSWRTWDSATPVLKEWFKAWKDDGS